LFFGKRLADREQRRRADDDRRDQPVLAATAIALGGVYPIAVVAAAGVVRQGGRPVAGGREDRRRGGGVGLRAGLRARRGRQPGQRETEDEAQAAVCDRVFHRRLLAQAAQALMRTGR